LFPDYTCRKMHNLPIGIAWQIPLWYLNFKYQNIIPGTQSMPVWMNWDLWLKKGPTNIPELYQHMVFPSDHSSSYSACIMLPFLYCAVLQ
jgi:hypothetical protein